MAFNDCIHLREEKDETGRNLCPYSPATSFACPYGSTESAFNYCPKYTNQTLMGVKMHTPDGGTGGFCIDSKSNGGSGIGPTPLVIHYSSEPITDREPTTIDYLKKVYYYLGKVIESMERENSDE